jgi:hypothetical protein
MAVKAQTSLAAAIEEVAGRDPMLASLVARVGSISYPPPNTGGHFGALCPRHRLPATGRQAAEAVLGRVVAASAGPPRPARG